jgi:hypothetical protein
VVVAGLFTGVVGNGIGWHGSDVVGSSGVVVVSPIDVDDTAGVLDDAVVDGDVDSDELPHAESNNAAQHATAAAIRILPSWHPGRHAPRHRYDSADPRSSVHASEESPCPS